MAQIHGKNGRFFSSGISLPIDSFTITRSRDMLDATIYGSSFRSYHAGLKTWSADISGTLDSTNAQQLEIRDFLEDASTGTISIIAMLTTNSSARQYNGSVQVEGDVITHSVVDTVKWQCKLRGTGALSWKATS